MADSSPHLPNSYEVNEEILEEKKGQKGTSCGKEWGWYPGEQLLDSLGAYERKDNIFHYYCTKS